MIIMHNCSVLMGSSLKKVYYNISPFFWKKISYMKLKSDIKSKFNKKFALA